MRGPHATLAPMQRLRHNFLSPCSATSQRTGGHGDLAVRMEGDKAKEQRQTGRKAIDGLMKAIDGRKAMTGERR